MLFLYLAVLMIALYWVAKILLPEMKKSPSHVTPVTDESDNTITKLETLLAEKNKDISRLETELKISQAQIRAFDKVKTLLDEEIRRLREQNRIFRSELGLPAAQPKENSIT